MASHHHHRHHHNASSKSCCCCSSSSCSCSCCWSSFPSPPPPTSTDQLLQVIANHFLLQSSPPPPRAHHHPPPQRKESPNRYETQAQGLLRSLHQRVAALESHLASFTSSSSYSLPPSPLEQPPVAPPPASSRGLRDVAARIIQARFRLFLVRRSQTLRHLQRLASIKSHAAALRSSLSDRAHLAPAAVSQKATDLLLQVDSVQSRDPTIREGKRSISRELVRILEFINKVSMKDHQAAIGAMEIAEKGSERRRSRPTSNPAGKKVSFAEDVDDFVAGVDTHEPLLSEFKGFSLQRRGSRDNERHYHRVLEEDEEGTQSHSLSEEDESPRGSVENAARPRMEGRFQGQNGNSGLSAPVPVQMEPRRS